MAWQIDITWPETGTNVNRMFTVTGSYWADDKIAPVTVGDHKIVCKLTNSTNSYERSITFPPSAAAYDWTMDLPASGAIADGTYTLTAELYVPHDAGAASASDTELDIIVSARGQRHAPIVFTFSEE